MGGQIAVESTLGIGTTFRFTLALPIADVSMLVDHGGTTKNGDLAHVLAGLDQPLQVLLAEDNATNQLVFSKMTQSLNVGLTIAANGREALEQASRRTFDIVFMDMRMPEMDGLQATREIRALGGPWAHIPIVALTANAFADDVKACRDAGMSDFVAKPIRKNLLIEKLAIAVADHPGQPDRATPSKTGRDDLPAVASAAVAMTDVSPILNREMFDALIEEIDIDGVRAALDVFFSESVEQLALLRKLCCENDRSKIKDEAHALKGAAGAFGLEQVSELARMLEHSAHQILPPDYDELIDRLEACFGMARIELEAALAESTARSPQCG
jgi:CheY-like chemotaxis protein